MVVTDVVDSLTAMNDDIYFLIRTRNFNISGCQPHFLCSFLDKSSFFACGTEPALIQYYYYSYKMPQTRETYHRKNEISLYSGRVMMAYRIMLTEWQSH